MFELPVQMMKAQMRKVKAQIDEFASKPLMENQHAMADAVQIVKGLVMIVVIGAIGVFIADEVVTTTGTPTQANLSAMQTNILETGETGSNFVVILVIAFIGGIAISYLALFSGKK